MNQHKEYKCIKFIITGSDLDFYDEVSNYSLKTKCLNSVSNTLNTGQDTV